MKARPFILASIVLIALTALVFLAVACADLQRTPIAVSATRASSISPTIVPPRSATATSARSVVLSTSIIASTSTPSRPPATSTLRPSSSTHSQPTATSTLRPNSPTPSRPPATSTLRPNSPTPKPPDAVVLADKLNLRNGPGTGYEIVGALLQGSSLKILGRSADKSWLQVKTDAGQQGWCSGDPQLVTVNVGLDQVAVAQNVPPVPPTATSVPSARPPTQDNYVLYFYFGAEGCPYSRRMGPIVERFYQAYWVQAMLPGHRPAGLAAMLPPAQQTSPRVQVLGVPVPGWGTNIDAFRSATGITFPVVGNPGLSVSTSTIPVMVMYNKQTGVHRVIMVGTTSYETLVSQANAFMDGRTVTTYPPGSG